MLNERFANLHWSDNAFVAECWEFAANKVRGDFGDGHGFVTEPASDGTQALVVLTDADLLRLYRARRSTGKAVPVVFSDSDELAGVVGGLPAAVTHVTFDPARKFHRRYPVGVLNKSLAGAA